MAKRARVAIGDIYQRAVEHYNPASPCSCMACQLDRNHGEARAWMKKKGRGINDVWLVSYGNWAGSWQVALVLESSSVKGKAKVLKWRDSSWRWTTRPTWVPLRDLKEADVTKLAVRNAVTSLRGGR